MKLIASRVACPLLPQVTAATDAKAENFPRQLIPKANQRSEYAVIVMLFTAFIAVAVVIITLAIATDRAPQDHSPISISISSIPTEASPPSTLEADEG